MPTVALCQQLNKAMLNKLNHEIHALPADDKIDTIVSKTQLPTVQKNTIRSVKIPQEQQA